MVSLLAALAHSVCSQYSSQRDPANMKVRSQQSSQNPPLAQQKLKSFQWFTPSRDLFALLPALPLVVSHQAYWLPYCFSNTPGRHQPQDICTCCPSVWNGKALDRETSLYPRHPHGSLTPLLPAFDEMPPSQWGLPWTSYVKLQIPPPLRLAIFFSLACFIFSPMYFV